MKINGERHHLWRAVDHEGEVLESYVTKTRDKRAALKFLKKAMRRYGKPETIITDKLRSYGTALKEIGAESAGKRALAEQQGRKFSLAVPKARAGDTARLTAPSVEAAHSEPQEIQGGKSLSWLWRSPWETPAPC